MKKKLIGILVMMLLIATTTITTTAEYDKNQNIIFEQNIPDNSEPQYMWLSDASVMPPLVGPHFNYEDFSNVPHPIHDITWWGNELTGDWPNLYGGDHEGMIFDIIFYGDNNGKPGSEVFVYNDLTAEITDTGIEYVRTGGDEDLYLNLYRFEVTELTPPCTLSNGWISIRGVDGDDEWFFWQESFEGNIQLLHGHDFDDLDTWDADLSLVFRTAVPETITFDGPDEGNYGEEQTYTIMAEGYPDYDMYYYIDWGDGTIDEWIGPCV
jgi:hypothetical protein